MYRPLIITEWSVKAFFSGLICLLTPGLFVACSSIQQMNLIEDEMVLRGKLSISFANQRLVMRYRFVGLPGNGTLYSRSLGGLVQNQVRIDQDRLFIYDTKSKQMIGYTIGMMERDFGVSLPFEAMTFWISGKPDPKHAYEVVIADNQGSLITFEQSGWTIFYESFAAGKDQNIPKRIKAKSGEIEVILTIDS